MYTHEIWVAASYTKVVTGLGGGTGISRGRVCGNGSASR